MGNTALDGGGKQSNFFKFPVLQHSTLACLAQKKVVHLSHAASPETSLRTKRDITVPPNALPRDPSVLSLIKDSVRTTL